MESTDLEYAKQLSKKAEKGHLSPFVNYINPESIDEPDNKENKTEVFPMMDLFMEDAFLNSYIEELDKVVEAGGPEPLPKTNREEAIELFTKAYFGKYPIKYFPNNTDQNHDRIIAEITIPEAERTTAEKFLGDVIKRLNNKQSKFTFMYQKDKYIFANLNEKKSEAKPSKPSTVEPEKENTSGMLDATENFALNDFKNIPLIKHYTENLGLSLKESVDAMESFILLNPFLALDVIDESMYKTKEDYEAALLEVFCNAVKYTGHEVDDYMANAVKTDIYCEEATKDFEDKSFIRKIFGIAKPLTSAEMLECDKIITGVMKKKHYPEIEYKRQINSVRNINGHTCGWLLLKYFAKSNKEHVQDIIHEANKTNTKYKFRVMRFSIPFQGTGLDRINGWPYMIYVVDKKETDDHLSKGLNQALLKESYIDDEIIEVTTEAVKHPDGISHNIESGKEAVKKGLKNVKNFVTNDPKTNRTGAERMAHDAKKHVLSPLVNGIKDMYEEVIGDEAERKEVIAGGLKGKLLKARRLFLKVILAYKTPVLLSALVAAGMGPAGILIKIVGWVAGFALATSTVAGDTSAKETKNTVIAELELELKIVREKIEDAKSAGDTKAKYELMRTENKIEQEIYRIKYGKYPRKSVAL